MRQTDLSQIKPFRPDYSKNFRCIGPACEDSCCEDWTVYIDQATFEKYQTLPAGPLRTLIDENIHRTPQGADGTEPEQNAFACVRMTSDQRCPLLSSDRLCQIQAEHGEAFLSHTCATYPRVAYAIDGVAEKALSLSCPEAARLVLLNPALLSSELLNPSTTAKQNSDQPAQDDAATNSSLRPHFLPIRDFALKLVRNRTYPLWQRMFLLGILCQRLDNIAHDDIRRAVPAFLRDFEVTIASGTLRIAMETLPTDHARQLDLVLQLAGLLLHRSNISPRFIKCIQAFTQGIGNGPGATLESLTAHYTTAHDHYYAPFFKKNPHILENYLINTIFRCRFPFGRDWVRTGATPSMAREFALLTAQFALMKGLLIGVAGFHREGLSAAHVIHTVQAASKHFEHHTEFLALSHDLLVESRMDSTSGLAILLRNAKSKTPRPTQPAIYAPGPTETTVAFPIRHLPDS